MKKIIIAAALAALGATQANAAFTPITIDPDGAGGASAITVTTLNWLAGNALAIGAGGSTNESISSYNTAILGAGLGITTLYQAQLNTFVNNSGGSSSTVSPAGQWTVVASINELVQTVSAASPTVTLTPVGGTVSIFYSPTAVANDIAGTGYTAGTEILRGTIVGGSGAFTNQTALGQALVGAGILPTNPYPLTNLDNFGQNNTPTVQSVQGNGQSTLKIDVGASAGDFINSAFFLTNVTTFDFALNGVEDANDNGQLVDPFNQANPSAQFFNGYVPQYSTALGTKVNGLAAADNGTNFTQNSDFQFQTLNTTSFNAIPEPSTMAISGLGLALMGFASRRRKSA